MFSQSLTEARATIVVSVARPTSRSVSLSFRPNATILTLQSATLTKAAAMTSDAILMFRDIQATASEEAQQESNRAARSARRDIQSVQRPITEVVPAEPLTTVTRGMAPLSHVSWNPQSRVVSGREQTFPALLHGTRPLHMQLLV